MAMVILKAILFRRSQMFIMIHRNNKAAESYLAP
jgi:hypothetical protein